MTGQRGITLIEMVVFIIVAGIFVPLSYIAFSAAIRSGAAPETLTNARFAAESKMEDLTSVRYDLINLATGSQTYTLWVGAASRSYTVYWSVTYVTENLGSSASDVGYKRIRVYLTSPTYEVNTIVTRRPGDENY
jgi:type II secretory pathway pseudopilin PulG